jgi:hypothetical protein
MDALQKGLRALPAVFPPKGLTARYRDFTGTHERRFRRFSDRHQMFRSIAARPKSR